MNKIRSAVLQDMGVYLMVQNWFFSFPDRQIGLSDLSSEVGISKTTANKVVLQMEKEGFLNIEKIGKTWRISVNNTHLYILTRKMPYHLSLVYNSGIIESIHNIIPNSRNIILFGSYRRGEDNEKSDLDIAVEVMDNETVRIFELGKIPIFGYRKNVIVNLHVFSRNKIDLNLFSNIANGIILEGFLEVRP